MAVAAVVAFGDGDEFTLVDMRVALLPLLVGGLHEGHVYLRVAGQHTLIVLVFPHAGIAPEVSVHLNCIKMGWNSPEGAINTVLLNSNVKPAYNLLSVINNGDMEDDDLSSFPVSWDGPNNGNTAPDYPTIVEGEGIGGSRCITVTTYPEPTETWHTEFYVKANEVMPQGSKYRLTMSIRA